MAKLIAIDLGSHSVKIAVYEGAFGRFQFEGLHAAPVPQALDAAPDLAARLQALGPLLAPLRGKGTPAVHATWPAERASVRNLTLPFGDKAQIAKVLPFEVEGLVPFDLEDMELRHRILQVEAGDSRVLALLVERGDLRETLSTMAAAGADPRSLELDADVLAEAASGEGVQVVVDLGHRRTLLALCRDGTLVAARALDVGGRDLTLALARARALDWDEAEARKHAASITPGEGGAASVAAEWEEEEQTQGHALRGAGEASDGEILRRLVLEQLALVRATLIGFEDGLGVGIDELVLLGGGRELKGLRALWTSALGVAVRVPEPPAGLPEGPAPGAFGLVSALGRRVTRGKAGPLDLRQGPFAHKGDLFVLRQVALYGGVFAACALLAGTAMFGWRSVQLHGEIDELDGQIVALVTETFPGEIDPAAIEGPSDAMALMSEKTLQVTTRVEALGAIVSDEPPTLALLRDLSTALPPATEARIDVEELSITTSTITLEGETDGYEAAARIETALQGSPRFAGAKRGDEKKSRSGGVSFTITIPREADAPAAEEG